MDVIDTNGKTRQRGGSYYVEQSTTFQPFMVDEPEEPAFDNETEVD